MNLIVDVGNTRIKAGLFRNRQLYRHKTFTLNDFTGIAEFLHDQPIENCIYASVVDDDSLFTLLKKRYPVLVPDKKINLPFKNLYKTPETLGNDRLANAAGALLTFPEENVLVLDAGTCLKTDFISKEKQYVGGSISPGLQMRFKALNTFTARLPLVEYQPFEGITGTTTNESILCGVINGMKSEMEGFISRYESSFGNLKVILTGGDAHIFDKSLKNSIFVAPYLALEGLNLILNHNVENIKR